jgi:hypothetical protein
VVVGIVVRRMNDVEIGLGVTGAAFVLAALAALSRGAWFWRSSRRCKQCSRSRSARGTIASP